MPVLPNTKNDLIAFFEQRVAAWTGNAALLGLTPAQTAALALAITAARTGYNAAQAAKQAAMNAVMTQDGQIAALRAMGADLIKLIKATAEANDDKNILAIASIPAPAEPAPLGPPAMPTDVTGFVDNTGAVRVTWRASTAGGTQFTVQRQLTAVNSTPGPWVTLDATPARGFVDSTVPQGFASAAYRVTAQRSGGASEPTEPTTVYFGAIGTAMPIAA